MNISPQKKSLIFLCIFFTIIVCVFVFEAFKNNFLLSNSFSNKSKKTIVLWQYWSGVEKKPLEDLVKKFNQEDHDFVVKLVSISMPKKKILLSVIGKVPPDLVHLDGDMVSDFALRGALEPLNNLFEPNYFKKFIPVYVEMLSFTDSALYAVPLMPSCEAMHINMNLLKKYRLDPPGSLEDLVRIFDRINYAPNNPGNEIGFLPSWPPWTGSFLPVVFGGTWATRTNACPAKAKAGDWCISANSAENIEAWTWVQKNFARKIKRDKLAAYTEGFHAYQSPDNPFYAGRIAVENSGVWERNLAKIFSPELQLSVSAFPGKVKQATYVSVDALAIPRAAKHIKEASEFMKWLHKQENLEYLALAQQKFSPLKEQSKEFLANHPNEYIDVFVDLAKSPNAKYFPQLPFSQFYKRQIKEAYLRVIRLEQSPEEALNELQIKIQKHL